MKFYRFNNKNLLILKLLLFMALKVAAESYSYYSINAPGVLKPNRKYSVVVALHDASVNCSLRVGIEGPSFNEFKNVNLQPFESQIVDFLPKHLEIGNYTLKAEGLSGLSFKNESELQVAFYDGPKIYIQTDKAIYKPEDLVRFRFVILDEHTRPLNITEPIIRVEVLDADDNHVKHFKNISLTHGIFCDKFKLSKYPTLGAWKIKVIIGGTFHYESYKMIKIFNYILPKFSVYIKAPSYVVLDDGNIKVAVYGKYTFDKYVEGNATIELFDDDDTKLLQTKMIDLQNLGFVDFNLKEIKDINKNYGLRVKAMLTEKITGITQQEQKYIYLKQQHYELQVPYDEIEFENNKPYSIRVYVKHWTGAPVLDYKTPVIMQHGSKTYESFLDHAGTATFEFEHDANADHQFKFKDSTTVLPNIYANENLKLNNREYYCRLKLLQTKLKLGQPVLIEVSSIVSIPYLMYTIMGHASLIHHEYIKVPPSQKSFVIEITPSIKMIPESFVYVYYVHKGQLRYEEIKLNFPYEFENQISISAPKQVKPHENVTITINAQPKSYVGILAVDLGVYLLDHTYDLNKYTILSDLHTEKSYSPIGAALYPGILSGLITLTNAHYPFQILNPPPMAKSAFARVYRFREKFPETWIFDNYFINETNTQLTLNVPDAITTWRITAFSNNHVTGFGMMDKPTDITTIQTFFITLNLPYSVKRDEIVNIPVTIFNYDHQAQEVKVVLHNDDKEFHFMEASTNTKSSDDHQQQKLISIAAEKGKTVKFLIHTIKSGEISLKVTATSAAYADAVLQKLKVEPEGVPREQNRELYLSIPSGEKLSTTLSIDKVEESVPDSDYITFSVGGHYLVPTIEHFQDLIQKPTGSGDQIMINFAPSVLILQYLKATGKQNKERQLVESLKNSIEVGYQQQLSFRHANGGYSVFGMATDEEPSSWLTAYVVRYFIKAAQFLEIEAKVIESDLEYLAKQQKSNGEFLFTGYLLNSYHRNEYELTAFILLAFLEDPHYAFKFTETITKGIEFLNKNSNNTSEINALCFMASCNKRAKLGNADMLIKRLKERSREGDGLRWWSANDKNLANDIELTANAALTLLDTPGDHTAILKWLIEQRNANGGFKSSYDTVVGMEALVKFSEKYKNLKNLNLKLTYSAKDELNNEVASDEFHIDSNNVLKFQKHELPKTTRHVKFEMQGNGASLVQLNHQYNINDNTHEFRYFNIQPNPILRNSEEFILELCFTYLSNTGSINDTTNMVTIEVNLQSGFRFLEANSESLLRNHNLVKHFDIQNSESLIIFYLDKLKANVKHCLTIPIDKVNDILMPKPAAIIVYDYYNLTRSNTKFYSF